jgi:integrase
MSQPNSSQSPQQLQLPLPGSPPPRPIALHWIQVSLLSPPTAHWNWRSIGSTPGWRPEATPTTRTSYLKAVTLFARYVDAKRTLISITPDDVLRFFAYDAGKGQVERRASKTIELHGTAVCAFFAALQEAKVLTVNPAQHMFPTKGQSPLPEYLFPGQAEQLRQAAPRLAADENHPRPRPHLLLILMLDLGLRLMEVEALKVGDIDATDAAHPIVYVRPTDRRHFAKRRGMNAPTELVEALKQYQQAYAIREGRLFPVDRKVLKEDVATLGRAVELPVRLSPERLRWTYALTQFRAGVANDRLQKQLGLSPLGWEDARKKLELMARPAM